MSCQILQRQSTYWDIMDRSRTVRVHFLNKEEYHFSNALINEYRFTDDHPLLLEYREPWTNLYIASGAARPAALVEAIVDAWKPNLGGWRSAFEYLTATDPERMLAEGFGQLLSAPEPLACIAADALTDAGVAFNALPSRPARWPREVLVADDNYVVAAGFRVEASVA